MRKNILILGGSRFIGYFILCELIKQNQNVTIYNRQSTIPPVLFPKGVKFIKGNRNNPENLKYLFNQKYDVVIDISGFTPDHIKSVIGKYSAKIGHYIFISTTGVYKVPPINPIREGSPRNFLKNTYSGDKALAENLLLSYLKELPITIFRPQGIFGPFDPCLPGLIFYRILNKLPIMIGNNSNNQTNHLFIFDLVKAVSLSIENPKASRKVYNIADDDNLTLNAFIDLCGQICKITPIKKDEEFIKNNKDIKLIKTKRRVSFFTEWPDFNMVCDNSLIKKDLEINFTNLNESLQKTYNWLIENKTKRLNYFHLRGENFILKNMPVSLYKKFVWKLFDFINSTISNLKKVLRSIKFIINPYRKIKNIIVQRTR